MKTRLKLIYLLSASLLLLSGCTKKNTSTSPDKKKAAAAAQKGSEAKADESKTQPPAPLDIPKTLPTPSPVDETAPETPATDSAGSTPAVDSSAEMTTPTDSSAGAGPLAVTPAPSMSTPSATSAPQPSTTVNQPPAKPTATTNTDTNTPPVTDDAETLFTKCLQEKSSIISGTLKTIAPREPTPTNFITLKNLMLKACDSKLDAQAKESDQYQLEASKLIVTETLKSFPNYEPIVKFFNAIENNTTFTPEQKDNIYKSYGSGGEISSKDIHFYGKLEGSKASPNVISYLITSATGTRTTRVFTSNSEIKKTITDLKSSPKTTNRYTFDFTPTQNNTYTLNISNGEAKLVVNVTFVKGDIKTLRERKAVTVALTAESWSKVQEEHLRRLISSEAKELISMPFALEREQTNMALVRTCSLDADNIACTDPDFTSRAVVKASTKAK